ncbi:porin family protein [Pedobacter heparinus]|uniref:porin family protein n=1 Tax=Pedobacter heparinus TaxID=984 RepID=UPI00292EFCAB|nr:porin family protein [Pedobacter heparinus]
MKRLFPGLLLLLLTGNLFAQNIRIPDYSFRLGLTAHPTFGWVKPEVGKSNSISLGFSYGLLGDFNFAENYSFSTGLTITTINGKSTEAFTVTPPGASTPSQGENEYKYKLQYIEVPLTVKLKTQKQNETRWYGQFGLSNDFKVGSKLDIKTSGQPEIKDGPANVKFYRAGLIIGAGGEFDISGNASIVAGLTYNNGFTDITSDNNTSVRSHYVGLNLAVFF